jgi:peptidoglycan/xylan/chitin deacetylase (PgdA/CDA1 family)
VIRWYVKKTARAVAAGMSWASGSIRLRELVGSGPRVRVLTYHRVRDVRREPFSVTVAEFDRQMAWLSQHHTVIPLNRFIDFVGGRRDIPPNAVLVTIDDGYEDLRSHALPILSKYRIPAVAFITAGEMAAATGTGDDRKLTSAEVDELARGGITIGSHAFDHRSLGRMTPDQAARQATVSRAALRRVTGTTVAAFAYPFGTRLDFSAATGVALRSAGYRCAFTSQHGPVTRTSDPMELPRIKVEGGDPFWVFRLAVRGGLDCWRLVDRIGAAWQSTERGTRSPNAAPAPASPKPTTLATRTLN